MFGSLLSYLRCWKVHRRRHSCIDVVVYKGMMIFFRQSKQPYYEIMIPTDLCNGGEPNSGIVDYHPCTEVFHVQLNISLNSPPTPHCTGRTGSTVHQRCPLRKVLCIRFAKSARLCEIFLAYFAVEF